MAISRLLQHGCEDDGGELRTLIGVEYFRLSIAGQRVLDRFDAEVRLHRDRQPPGQRPAKPIHDGAIEADPRAIGTYVMSIAPDLVGPGDRQLAQGIGSFCDLALEVGRR